MASSLSAHEQPVSPICRRIYSMRASVTTIHLDGVTMDEDCGAPFDAAMFDIYRKAKEEAGYQATLFLQMLSNRGGLSTAKYLINTTKPSDGYTALSERNRLDLTVEALVVENRRWHKCFSSEELDKARARLKQYGYKPKD